MKELVTSKIEEVRYNGGHSTRKPSTVTMAVPHKFAVQVADLIEEYEKQGIEPEDGLIRLELVAFYADPDEKPEPEEAPVETEESLSEIEEGEEIIEDMENKLDVTLGVEEDYPRD